MTRGCYICDRRVCLPREPKAKSADSWTAAWASRAKARPAASVLKIGMCAECVRAFAKHRARAGEDIDVNGRWIAARVWHFARKHLAVGLPLRNPRPALSRRGKP